MLLRGVLGWQGHTKAFLTDHAERELVQQLNAFVGAHAVTIQRWVRVWLPRRRAGRAERERKAREDEEQRVKEGVERTERPVKEADVTREAEGGGEERTGQDGRRVGREYEKQKEKEIDDEISRREQELNIKEQELRRREEELEAEEDEMRMEAVQKDERRVSRRPSGVAAAPIEALADILSGQEIVLKSSFVLKDGGGTPHPPPHNATTVVSELVCYVD